MTVTRVAREPPAPGWCPGTPAIAILSGQSDCRPSSGNGLFAEVHMSDTPVLDTIGAMTAVSVELSQLPAREHMIARLAALIAVGAPPLSYLANAGVASDVGVTASDVQDVLVAVAPIVGTARVTAAAGNITRALGFVVAVAEASLAAELDGD